MKFLLSFSFIHILGFYLPSLPSYIFNSSNCKDDMCNSSRKCKNRLVKYHLGGFPLSPLGPGFPVCHTTHTSIYTLYCIIVHIFKHPKCVNENQQRGNLSERRRSMPNGLRSCIQISLMCSCLKSTQTYQLVRFSLWNGN